MLIAAGTNGRTGRKVLFIGLDAENIRRLQNDEPIHRSLEIEELEQWDLAIMGPEDSARFVARFHPGADVDWPPQ
jgi:hypothetical protein